MSDNTWWIYLAVLGVTCLSSLGHLFLKKNTLSGKQNSLIKKVVSVWFVFGITFLVLGTILFTLLLRKQKLTYILPITASAYFFVPFGASIWFDEKLSSRFWLGVTCIMIGICLTFL